MESSIVNLFDVDSEPMCYGPVFSLESADLDCNFLRFDKGEGVPLHINAHVDVAGVVLQGEGFLQVDGKQHLLGRGRLFLHPQRGCSQAAERRWAVFLPQLPCAPPLPPSGRLGAASRCPGRRQRRRHCPLCRISQPGPGRLCPSFRDPLRRFRKREASKVGARLTMSPCRGILTYPESAANLTIQESRSWMLR